MSKPVQSSVAVPMGQSNATAVELKNSGFAIASMVCGIVGLFVFGVILGTLAIIFGVIALNKINERPNELKGLCQAKAGIVCGCVAIVLWIILIIVIWA